MINRNNRYQSINPKSLHGIINRFKKKVLIVLSGIVLTTTLFTGCNNVQTKTAPHITQSDTDAFYYNVIIEPNELSSLDHAIEELKIYETNLADISELSNYKNLKYVYLSNNNITDISPLENLPIIYLYITNNNVKKINIENFKSLEHISIEGNFNLYTQELLDYCKNNNISIDITEKDVKNVETIREMLKQIDFDGKTDYEKETAICDFVCNHMSYDYDACIKIIAGNIDEDYDSSGLDGAVSGKGVCQSYATLFTAMCQLEGINSYTKDGMALGILPHIWSLVEIDGQYILYDPTNDDNNILFEDYFFSNSTGSDAKIFMAINETTEVVRKQVESSDTSKIPKYEEEKRHKLMIALLKCVILGSLIFIPAKIGKEIKKRKQMESACNQTPKAK